MRGAAAGIVTAALLAAAACSSSDDAPKSAASTPRTTVGVSPSGSAPPAGSSPKVTVAGTITGNLKTPWGMAFLPDGTALVGSRDTAAVVRVTEDGDKEPVGTVPGVRTADGAGEGGLLGLAVSPTFERDHLVYAYLTSPRDNRIVRMRLEGDQLGRPSPVLTGIPSGTNHNGGRIAFGPDGMLYAGTGERYESSLAQDKRSLGGKILRMRPDGEPAPGNPFPDSVVYSLGHRNVQGLAWDAQGRLWASEFGQHTWDELNLIRPGGNYGWPVVEGMSDDEAKKKKYINPVAQWRTAEASPSGIAYADGAIWMASLRGERLWRVVLDGTRVSGRPKAFVTDRGRLRTVVHAPDGSLWLTTSNTDGRGAPRDGDDRLLRLTVR
ncbi:glucose sorbosone dehydrogenase [Wenjunlia vitaminophila]|uniref:Glucose sorbosone dehydrogenase n=1 Tax=Wenjunlia vitaminophila TaxID=76728 RepID=A0A0T6LTM5_WENVI|nr:glucose sorbosone dehydrogenase [Wenjunlia vitaminophila]